MLDRLGGLLLSLLFAIPMVIVALLVRVRIGSPVLYRQQRVGLDGKPFAIFKFRTMSVDRRVGDHAFEGPDRRVVHKSIGDPRVGPTGRFLRKFSLDELPQIWNVITGDMSLVGPRPEMPAIVSGYEPWQHARHLVKPGLTCTWQIEGRDRLLHECTEMDIEYIESMTFLTDVAILIRTPLSMIGRGRGF